MSNKLAKSEVEVHKKSITISLFVYYIKMIDNPQKIQTERHAIRGSKLTLNETPIIGKTKEICKLQKKAVIIPEYNF